MICLCSEKELRKAFIATFRALCDKARKTYQKWKSGDVRLEIPPGLFAPRVPNLISAVSVFS
jgi:hypothetical protein